MPLTVLLGILKVPEVTVPFLADDGRQLSFRLFSQKDKPSQELVQCDICGRFITVDRRHILGKLRNHRGKGECQKQQSKQAKEQQIVEEKAREEATRSNLFWRATDKEEATESNAHQTAPTTNFESENRSTLRAWRILDFAYATENPQRSEAFTYADGEEQPEERVDAVRRLLFPASERQEGSNVLPPSSPFTAYSSEVDQDSFGSVVQNHTEERCTGEVDEEDNPCRGQSLLALTCISRE
ncbi:hypothetical protein CPC08DRAFT_763311 [Agrocybe pediades]|nr:hypothetical protein CPC08DRAFT_763311 [Agrocybe pediades]